MESRGWYGKPRALESPMTTTRSALSGEAGNVRGSSGSGRLPIARHTARPTSATIIIARIDAQGTNARAQRRHLPCRRCERTSWMQKKMEPARATGRRTPYPTRQAMRKPSIRGRRVGRGTKFQRSGTSIEPATSRVTPTATASPRASRCQSDFRGWSVVTVTITLLEPRGWRTTAFQRFPDRIAPASTARNAARSRRPRA